MNPGLFREACNAHSTATGGWIRDLSYKARFRTRNRDHEWLYKPAVTGSYNPRVGRTRPRISCGTESLMMVACYRVESIYRSSVARMMWPLRYPRDLVLRNLVQRSGGSEVHIKVDWLADYTLQHPEIFRRKRSISFFETYRN